MRVEQREDHTAVLLERDEVIRLCKPGADADTCIWLVIGGDDGFECLYYCRNVPNLHGQTLEDRWKKGLTVAKRDGCDEIKKIAIKIEPTSVLDNPEPGDIIILPGPQAFNEQNWRFN